MCLSFLLDCECHEDNGPYFIYFDVHLPESVLITHSFVLPMFSGHTHIFTYSILYQDNFFISLSLRL